MKKIILFLLAMFSSIAIVNAEDYYINENDVVLTKMNMILFHKYIGKDIKIL